MTVSKGFRATSFKSLCILMLIPFFVAACGFVEISLKTSEPAPDASCADLLSWHDVDISLDGQDLPVGVDIEVIEDEFGHRNIILIKNSNTEPLYLLGPFPEEITDFVPYNGSILSLQGLAPLWKICLNKPSAWMRAYPEWHWVDLSNTNAYPRDRIEIYVDWGHLQTPTLAVGYFMDVQRLSENRPADIQPKENQYSRLFFSYSDQLIEVPLTISFPVNPHYNPARGCEIGPCSNSSNVE